MKPAVAAPSLASRSHPSSLRFRTGYRRAHQEILLPSETSISQEILSQESQIQGKKSFSSGKDLPIRGRAQGGEDGNLVLDENPIDWTYRPADLQGVHGAFAVFVTGNSMVPKYKNHDIAYIHPTERPRRGRYVLVETAEHGGFIKQFEGWEKDTLLVRQFNPAKTLRFDRGEIHNVMLVIGSLDA